MSKKILNKLLAYAKQFEAENLVLNSEQNEIKTTFYHSNGQRDNFALPTKYFQSIKDEILRLAKQEDFEIVKIKKQKIYYKSNGNNVEFHLSVATLGNTEKIIFDFKQSRLEKNWRLNELGIKLGDKKKLLSLIKSKNGLYIFAGEKGSGKSSTLKALVNELISDHKSITYLSNKPEIKNERVCNLELNDKTLQYLKKSDSDIIAIDEVSSTKQLNESLKLAQEGRFVFISIEASCTNDLLQKIKSTSFSRKQLSEIITVISFQKLVRLRRLVNNKRDKRQEIAKFKFIINKK